MIVKLEFSLPDRIEEYESCMNGKLYKQLVLDLAEIIKASKDPELYAMAKELIDELIKPPDKNTYMN